MTRMARSIRLSCLIVVLICSSDMILGQLRQSGLDFVSIALAPMPCCSVVVKPSPQRAPFAQPLLKTLPMFCSTAQHTQRHAPCASPNSHVCSYCSLLTLFLAVFRRGCNWRQSAQECVMLYWLPEHSCNLLIRSDSCSPELSSCPCL